MCACEPGWTCSRCRDTPADPNYEEWFRCLDGEGGVCGECSDCSPAEPA